MVHDGGDRDGKNYLGNGHIQPRTKRTMRTEAMCITGGFLAVSLQSLHPLPCLPSRLPPPPPLPPPSGSAAGPF